MNESGLSPNLQSLTLGRNDRLVLASAGILLMICMAAVSHLSHRFVYGSPMLERPVTTFVGVMMMAGVVYLVAVHATVRLPRSTGLLAWILLVGIVLRTLLFASSPILEDDWYRYLWDGGVTASGHNPFAYIPSDVFDANEDVPKELVLLAQDSGLIAQRLNHPSLGTVYPPLSQAAFALAHWIEPWSLYAWRGVLLGFDAATLLLLGFLLRAMNRPLHWLVIYWWNPVVLKETLNSAHMDMLVLPFVVLAVLLVIRQKPVLSGITLALAVAAKLWPVVLAPLLIRNLRAVPSRLLGAVAAGTVVLLGVASPMIAALRFKDDSGFYAYGERWEMNDALFMIYLKASELAGSAFGFGGDQADLLARIAVGTTVLLWTLWLCRKPAVSSEQLLNRALLIVGAVFMLSPTQFPWYYLWMMPFLVVTPRWSLLVLTAMLPMYYLKFYYSALDNVNFFHNRLVWVEYAPTLLLLLWETARGVRGRRILPHAA